jgi:hypothetical protein
MPNDFLPPSTGRCVIKRANLAPDAEITVNFNDTGLPRTGAAFSLLNDDNDE